MATKHVKETLGEFQDYTYFSLLEEKKEKESSDDKKLKNEEAKDGMDAIKKLRDNLSRFETAAGGKILKYKEFWEENQSAASEFDEEGNIYKLWDSDYVAGVLNLPDEALSDDELNAQIEIVDQEGGDEDNDEDTTDEEEVEDEEDDEEKDDDKEDKKKDKKEDEDEEEDEKLEKDEEEGEEIEEGNAFSGAVKKAKDKKKKDFKFKGKKFPVKESLLESEEFDLDVEEDNSLDESLVVERYRKLFEAEEAEEEEVEVEEDPAEGEEEGDAGEFAGFDPGALDGDLDGDGKDEGAAEDVEVTDGEAIEVGDLDGDGSAEGGMEFAGQGESRECFVIYDMAGSEREEVFRTDNPKVIEEFKDFFENEFKASIKAQIQAFKQAQEEKRAAAEAKAKEAIRAERKEKLDTFLKESFDEDDYEEPFVLSDGDEDEEDGTFMDYDEYLPDEGQEAVLRHEEASFNLWKDDLIQILVDDYSIPEEEARSSVEERDLEEAYESDIPLEEIAAGIADTYESWKD